MIIISFNIIEATETFTIEVDDPKKPNIYIVILRFHNECYTDCFVCMTFKMIHYIPYMVMLIYDFLLYDTTSLICIHN